MRSEWAAWYSQPTAFQLFWKHLSIDPGNCWDWQGKASDKGYCMQRGVPVHRLSYEFFNGPIPKGLVIDHICRNRKCVNPEHLRPLTLVENVMIGEGITATNKRKTHCIHGHEFSKENTRIIKGERHCKTCVLRRKVEFRERQRCA